MSHVKTALADRKMVGRAIKDSFIKLNPKIQKTLVYSVPSNLSPESEEYAQLVELRAERIKSANPEMGDTPIPEDLVTCSGSGLDPHISPAAAEYQVKRLARENDMTEDEVRTIIAKCTDGRFLGIFGEETVNVLEVNLMLDGILE